MKKVKFAQPTYIKVILILLLSLLPLYLLIAGILISNYNMVKNEVIKSKNQAISFYSESVFDDLDNTQIKIYQLLGGTDMGYFTVLGSNQDEYLNKSELALRIQEQLINVMTANAYVKEISIVTENGDIITSSSIGLNNVTASRELYDQFMKNGRNLLFDEKNGVLYMLACFPARSVLSNENPSVIAFVQLSTSDIQGTIAEFCSIGESDGQIVLSSLDKTWSIYDPGRQDSDRIPEFLQTIGRDSASQKVLHKVALSGKTFWSASITSETLGLQIVLYLDRLPVNAPVGNLILLFLLVALVTIVIVRVDWYLIKLVVATPVNALIHALKKTEQNEYDEIKEQYHDDDFKYIFKQFNNLASEMKENTARMYEHRMRTQEAEFKHLQVQINPHFFYNSMFTISRLAKDGNNELAGRFADYLGNYFSYITRTGISLIPLKDELKHVQTYINIMSIRFPERVQVFLENDMQNQDFLIPKLIIQPLVENAFAHGVKDVLADGEIHIRIFSSPSSLTISVEDNGGTADEELVEYLSAVVNQPLEPVNMTGLANVNKRLKIYFGEESGLSFSINEYNGLQCVIRIPMKVES